MREREQESGEAEVRATPSLDLVFELLSNRRRRYALYHLSEQPDGVATIAEIVDNIVMIERDDEDSEGESEQRRLEVQTELQHVHLPKLADAGVIEHDQRSETVRYWNQPSLEEWLEHAHHKELS